MSESKEPDQPKVEAVQNEMSEDEIDRNLADTFPASDPPSWTLGTNHSAAPGAEPPEPDVPERK